MLAKIQNSFAMSCAKGPPASSTAWFIALVFAPRWSFAGGGQWCRWHEARELVVHAARHLQVLHDRRQRLRGEVLDPGALPRADLVDQQLRGLLVILDLRIDVAQVECRALE